MQASNKVKKGVILYFNNMFSKYSNTCTEQTSNWTDPQSFCITRALDELKKKNRRKARLWLLWYKYWSMWYVLVVCSSRWNGLL